jgi:uncharacterized protein
MRKGILMICLSWAIVSSIACADSVNWDGVLSEQQALADKGDVNALWTLGVFYKEGLGVKKDTVRAISLLNSAASRGSPEAMLNLSEMYYSDPSEDSQVRGFEWLRKATLAYGNSAVLEYKLGMSYLNGTGVDKDVESSVKWLTKAALKKYIDANYNLGLIYEGKYGEGLNLRMAAKHYLQAAELGDSGAQANLGALYINGTGVLQDYVKGYMWSNIAAARGDKTGRKNRDDVLRRLTPQERQKAQEDSSRCMEAKKFKNC